MVNSKAVNSEMFNFESLCVKLQSLVPGDALKAFTVDVFKQSNVFHFKSSRQLYSICSLTEQIKIKREKTDVFLTRTFDSVFNDKVSYCAACLNYEFLFKDATDDLISKRSGSCDEFLFMGHAYASIELFNVIDSLSDGEMTFDALVSCWRGFKKLVKLQEEFLKDSNSEVFILIENFKVKILNHIYSLQTFLLSKENLFETSVDVFIKAYKEQSRLSSNPYRLRTLASSLKENKEKLLTLMFSYYNVSSKENLNEFHSDVRALVKTNFKELLQPHVVPEGSLDKSSLNEEINPSHFLSDVCFNVKSFLSLLTLFMVDDTVNNLTAFIEPPSKTTVATTSDVSLLVTSDAKRVGIAFYKIFKHAMGSNTLLHLFLRFNDGKVFALLPKCFYPFLSFEVSSHIFIPSGVSDEVINMTLVLMGDGLPLDVAFETATLI